ncbi:SRPBCC family protein [Streptomyces calidiresistens]|uniref:SRPBCC family protein n=1 Tax=Streptomyces calidiresistens TaxID=1485586 RepID=A0A7W3T3K9_9ACTN|nr:SRPBCC family protein [Streptomyces calidiresistens]MBB0230325.1 SRPBCC family protein [Streptomyces calidiresistens]
MAVRPVLIRRSPRVVWEVLSDRRCYAEWVVGTREARPSHGDWPEPGSALRYEMGVGRWRLPGRTVVRVCEPGKRLELEAEAGRLGTARIALELRPWGEDTLVIVDEHPLTGPGGRLHNALSEALLHQRHRRMLRNLASVVEAADSSTDSGVGTSPGR